jgi:acyltransferase
MEQKIRYAWPDYVKFISIFLVILFHTPPHMEILDEKILVNLRIPAFFFISGYLYNVAKFNNFWHFFRHRGKQLLVPYVTFFVLFYILWLIEYKVWGTQGQVVNVYQPIIEFIKGEPLLVLPTFWFVACLFSMQVIYYFLQWALPSKWVFPVCILLSFTAYFIGWTNYWNICNALFFIPFFAFGNCFKEHISNISFSNKKRTILLIFFALVSIAVMVWSICIENRGVMNIVKVMCGLMVIPAYICITKLLAGKYGRRRFIEFVAVNGVFFFAFQNEFIEFFRVILDKLFFQGIMFEYIWIKPLVAIVVLIIIFPVAWIVTRYMPWMVGKGKFFDKI